MEFLAFQVGFFVLRINIAFGWHVYPMIMKKDK